MKMLAALAFSAVSCARVQPPPPGPPPFRVVKRVALVKWIERGEVRRPDPLDGLGQTLQARGFEVSILELGPKLRDDLRGLDKLHDEASWHVGTGSLGAKRPRQAERLSTPTDALLDRLDADAIVFSYRLGQVPAWYQPAAPYGPFGPLGADPYARPRAPLRPAGAFTLIGRGGALLSFEWASQAGMAEPAMPANAAEAIEQLVRAIGEPPENAQPEGEPHWLGPAGEDG